MQKILSVLLLPGAAVPGFFARTAPAGAPEAAASSDPGPALGKA